MANRVGVYAFDLTGISNKSHRAMIQGALNASDYPYKRIRRKTGKRVPVTIADTSRFTGTAEEMHAAGHAAGVSPLVSPEVRAAALGLYWLPTREHPAGRIEVSQDILDDVPLVQEVFLAEAAHAVDYGAMTDEQRAALFRIVHGGSDAPHGTHGWFEERGGNDYWADWVGETFMALFMRAFAPSLARPLEARQPWTHEVTDQMAAEARIALL